MSTNDPTLPRRIFLGAASVLLGSVAQSAAGAGCRAVDSSDPGPRARPVPSQAPARQDLAALADVKLWYWDSGGHGTPLVLLHPFTGSGRVWLYQQPVFAQAGYRVIGYSRRGFENSQSGDASARGTGSGDLHALLDSLGIARFHAVASAGGAFVAADYALSHPERLLSLTLACSMLGVEDPEFARMSGALQSPEFNQLPAYLRELGPSYRAVDPEGTQHWRELEASSMSGEKFRQPNANTLTLAALAGMRVPTLMLCGDADLIAPPPLMRQLAQHIPSSELHILPECGHSGYWERPDLFNQHVLRFVQRHSHSARA